MHPVSQMASVCQFRRGRKRRKRKGGGGRRMRGSAGGADGAGRGQDEHAGGGDVRARPYRFMVGAYRCSCRLYSRTWAAIPGGGGVRGGGRVPTRICLGSFFFRICHQPFVRPTSAFPPPSRPDITIRNRRACNRIRSHRHGRPIGLARPSIGPMVQVDLHSRK